MSSEYPYEARLNLWHRVRLAWWIVTRPAMTELRLVKTMLDFHERRVRNGG